LQPVLQCTLYNPVTAETVTLIVLWITWRLE
jgi:hypothetical protein